MITPMTRSTYTAKKLPVVTPISWRPNSYITNEDGGETKVPGYVRYKNQVGAECVKTWDQFHEDYE